MRLESIDVALIKDAVGTFLEQAWGDLADAHWPKRIDFADTDRDRVLAGFADERKNGCMRKFTLRLGNRRYPFMKMVFQELLFRDFFFFSVDSHDELDIKETTPDYAEWLAIRDYNRTIKDTVEAQWRRHEIPTLDDILEEVEKHTVPEEQLCTLNRKPLIHVVDDDTSIAEGLSRILDRRGYVVEVSHSAEEALEKLSHRLPDLVISDLEMGKGLTGLQFCERIRRSKQWAALPFILATAAGIDLTRFNLIDGFLVKPYEIEVLLEFVSKHVIPQSRGVD